MVRLGTTLVRPLAGGPLWNAHAESSPSKNGMHCSALQAQRSIALAIAGNAHMFTFGQAARYIRSIHRSVRKPASRAGRPVAPTPVHRTNAARR